VPGGHEGLSLQSPELLPHVLIEVRSYRCSYVGV